MYTNNTTSTLTIVQNLAITTARQSVSSYPAQLSPNVQYDRVGENVSQDPKSLHLLRGMVRLSHFTSCFSCTICTFLHRFEAVPGAVDLSRVIQEEIRGHFADQETAPPTSEEVGFLLKDAFTTRPEVGKATSMLVYGSNVSQKMQDTIISRKYPRHDPAAYHTFIRAKPSS